jgi:L-alanine-DL-glutamate epimerase-like enolase superfamily enzyme
MSAPIAFSRVIPYQIPVHVPFAIATQTLPQARGAFIEVTSETGHTGLGEAAPFPVLTKDDATICAIHSAELLDSLKDLSPRDALERLATLRQESFAISRTAYVGVESALWDLMAKEQGLPLAHIWGHGTLTSLRTDPGGSLATDSVTSSTSRS